LQGRFEEVGGRLVALLHRHPGWKGLGRFRTSDSYDIADALLDSYDIADALLDSYDIADALLDSYDITDALLKHTPEDLAAGRATYLHTIISMCVFECLIRSLVNAAYSNDLQHS